MHNHFLSNISILLFTAGVVWVQQLAVLPDWLGCGVLIGLVFVLLGLRCWALTALLLGLLWSILFAYLRLADVLPDSALGMEVTLQGYIASLPQQQPDRVGFDFIVTDAPKPVPGKLRLAWYHAPQTLRAGQSWRFAVKLKPLHGRLNPGEFDYQAWLFANHFGATGYVRTPPDAQLLAQNFGVAQSFAAWRQRLADGMDAQLPGSEFAGILKALVLGAQGDIGSQQWQVFRDTGTTHLAVISGSHITLVAGLLYWLIWRGGLLLSLPAAPLRLLAAGAAGLCAVVYALLAGWNVPAQRAVVMVLVGLWALTAQRNVSLMRVFCLALLAVVLCDPLSVIAAGFWLSFGAVALLAYSGGGRLRPRGFWHELLAAQLAVCVGLTPLLVYLFQQISLLSPLANLLALPLIGWLIVPLALAGVLLQVWPPLGAALLHAAEYGLSLLWQGLQWLADLPWAQWYAPAPPFWAFALACCGSLLLLAPRGVPGRALGAFLWLPMLLPTLNRPPPGEARMTMLDVGQGLALVVQTNRHLLLFDAGAKFSEQSDMGSAVIVPFVRNAGFNAVDLLLISHGDNDHCGGADSIRAALPVRQWLSSEQPWAGYDNAALCRAGQEWQWDGVTFKVLSPPPTAFQRQNDNSCVLQVITAQQRWLLTGDIEAEAEARLSAAWGAALRSTVLVAPHHGSKTSSGAAFLQQVRPQWLLIPAGYANRFHFPHADTLQRYRQIGATYFSSAEDGAVTVQSHGAAVDIVTARQQMRHYWQTPPQVDARME
jgi:competence protein ComEC